MTQSIQEGLGRLFDRIIPLADSFHKNRYETAFREEYERFHPLLAEIAQYCMTAGDQAAAGEEIAAELPRRMRLLLEQERSRRKRDTLRMNYNMGMVAYVIPLFRYDRMEIMERIVDRMVELWNEDSGDMKIEKSTFEQIQGGFRSHFCYITTAVCRSLGKPDDCYELNLFRDYRDHCLAGTEEGKAMIREYYDVAPTIVRRIDRREDADRVYEQIWSEYLEPCVHFLETGRTEDCRRRYQELVRQMERRYLYAECGGEQGAL